MSKALKKQMASELSKDFVAVEAFWCLTTRDSTPLRLIHSGSCFMTTSSLQKL